MQYKNLKEMIEKEFKLSSEIVARECFGDIEFSG